ncbi:MULTISPECIES: hypothetical protein [unclassified Sporosarcina]|uniref:hypothetical protein n=1 Tax=unclassified Sporosarcina TaxID=2647733 RepID=UPI00203A960C|nr:MULTISPECIES: hypothetical protein [unclassified Sporosarcina]GKV65424.1 hypothetical protein NCCP2331_15770 [Sporosarcina sp. NCCP-2331]GLB55548.1 hypothetical protein NCCP2378_13350 [Sporosarcina sp. NCCP-2378]
MPGAFGAAEMRIGAVQPVKRAALDVFGSLPVVFRADSRHFRAFEEAPRILFSKIKAVADACFRH